MWLILVLAFPVLVANLARVTTVEEKLSDPLVRVDAIKQSGAVTDLQRQVTFPAAFSRCDVNQDA